MTPRLHWTRTLVPILPLLLAAIVQAQPRPGIERAQVAGNDVRQLWSRGQAEGKGPVRFTHAPLHLEDIAQIVPLGLMVGGHVTPIDHQYYYPKPMRAGEPHFEVVAPAAGHIVMIGHRVKLTGSSERQREYDDYSLILEHSSTFYCHYDLLTGLDKSLLDKLDESARNAFAQKLGGPPRHVRIPVHGGQVLGKVGGRSLDFGVINTEVTLPGFLTPELYGHYAWRIHTVDPFDFFDEPLKAKLLKLNARKVKPLGGKIDYDIDGKLVGNWFQKETGGYAGNRDRRGYWMGHLAFAYHHIEPENIVISIGDFGGQPRQFWVRGNTPDPAKISAADGVVRYELVWAKLGGNGKRYEGLDDRVQGVVLVQLLADRQLKLEAFPGKAGLEVTGFTDAARLYER